MRALRAYIDIPPIWLFLAAAVVWILARELPLIMAFGPVFRVGGCLTIAVGVAVILWAAWFFYRAKTPIEPRHTPKALITSGPFKYSRNPIYLGMVLILIGWVLVLGALSPVLIPYLYFWMVDQRFAAPEEEGLRHAFGVEGLRYIQTTPRWI
ncbi:methyltransferase family protein [Roseobacter sp. HKCCA0882]|jgi:protein-S-isoprenylcysteine O-methyltransferase Ste14|uniref:methyltransferase family protein n=1 Tax=Roseobacter sp. HKCCA0882 TaxID=3120337 RepID=UPI0030EB4666